MILIKYESELVGTLQNVWERMLVGHNIFHRSTPVLWALRI